MAHHGHSRKTSPFLPSLISAISTITFKSSFLFLTIHTFLPHFSNLLSEIGYEQVLEIIIMFCFYILVVGYVSISKCLVSKVLVGFWPHSLHLAFYHVFDGDAWWTENGFTNNKQEIRFWYHFWCSQIKFTLNWECKFHPRTYDIRILQNSQSIVSYCSRYQSLIPTTDARNP